jgi:hypothetical protein
MKMTKVLKLLMALPLLSAFAGGMVKADECPSSHYCCWYGGAVWVWKQIYWDEGMQACREDWYQSTGCEPFVDEPAC